MSLKKHIKLILQNVLIFGDICGFQNQYLPQSVWFVAGKWMKMKFRIFSNIVEPLFDLRTSVDEIYDGFF